MYWYIKYPLYLFVLSLLAICAYFVWTHLPSPVIDKVQQLIPGREKEPLENITSANMASSKPELSATHQENLKSPLGIVSSASTKPEVNPALPPFDYLLFEQQTIAAEDFLKKDQPLFAKDLMEKVLETPGIHEFDPQWLRAVDILSRANSILINTDAPAPDKIRYIIQPGDTLIGMANKFQTTVAAIEKGNRLDLTKTNIYPGMVLNVFNGKWSISVVKTRFVLTLSNNNRIFKFYRVGIGRQNRTPVGLFKIVSKLRDPVWTPPGKVIPFGDPENVLGTRWLGLQPAEGTDSTLKGYGIHGTWQPETIGTAASEGCIRMKNDDINELFDIVPMGTPVSIKDE